MIEETVARIEQMEKNQQGALGTKGLDDGSYNEIVSRERGS